MSASEPETAIFLDDSPEAAKKKVQRAFSGGRESIEKHRELGGMPEVDRAYEILRFHHPDTKFVENVYQEYKSGRMLTGELKKITIDFLTEFLSKHQEKVEKNLATANELVYGK